MTIKRTWSMHDVECELMELSPMKASRTPTQLVHTAKKSSVLAAIENCCPAPEFNPHAADSDTLKFMWDLSQSMWPGHASALGQGAEFWLCCAELNQILNKNFRFLPAPALKSLHSFTRSTKEGLWQKMCSAYKLDPATACSDSSAPMHMMMLSTILGFAFAPYPDASAVRYTFTKPPWMFGWSNKWKQCQSELSVIEVRAFAHTGAAAVGQHPARVLYIPVF